MDEIYYSASEASFTNPIEPKKPISAYALFFKDTVSAIKGQRPDVTYAEICAIVASMWEALDENHKNVYHKKNEIAKKEYIMQMSAYRQQQQQQQQQQQLQQQQQQQQLQQQQQQQSQQHLNDFPNETQMISTTTSPRQQLTKPAVFTIARPNMDASTTTTTTTTQIQSQQLATHSVQAPQPLSFQHQQMTTAPTDSADVNTTISSMVNNFNSCSDPSQYSNLLPNDSNNCMAQKCIRENCTKRAIINPDWEDEYCSNECVVLHCRNVFNSWIQSNLESRTE